jgi:PAS domain S-box-containing protein
MKRIDSLRILHLEDDSRDTELVRSTLAADDIVAEIERVETKQDFLAQLARPDLDLILADFSLPSFDGLTALALAREQRPELPFILVSGAIGEETALESIRSGATDYIPKDLMQRLPASVRRALREVEERKVQQQAIDALQKSENRYRLLFETALDCVITMDHKGRIIEFNPAAESTFGYSRDEAIGKSMADLIIPPRLRSAHRAGLHKYLTTGEAPILGKRIEITAVRANGEEFPIELSVSDTKGSHPVFTGFIRDITERKQAEAALHETNQKLQTFIQASPLAIVALDMQRRVTLWNRAAERLFGWTESEVMGQVVPTIPEEDLPKHLALREHILLNDTVVSDQEGRRLRKDGSIIPISVSFAPLRDAQGAIAGTIGIIADITERKQALAEVQKKTEELALMTQQLWQASKLATMGELAASVAHELNNPLAIISLRTESLVEQLADEPLRESAEIIMQEVDRMADLVNNLLQFSRRGHRQTSTVDVAEEISNSVNFIAYYLRNRNIKVIFDFVPDLLMVQADRQQLRQLFLNLLTNASDAMEGGGTLTIKTRSADLGEAKSVIIEFADTGVGIAPENLERIWDSFFTTKPAGKGTGLGLSICRRIVEDHGGTITIESQAKQGTTVRIELPATANGLRGLRPEDVIVAE